MKRTRTAPSPSPFAESLSGIAHDRLEAWSTEDRDALAELLSVLPDGLHRELVGRSVASGRSAVEVLGFARALQPMSSADAIAACTFKGKTAALELRLRAASDPLFAFESNGRPASRSGLPLSARVHHAAPPPESLPTVLIDPHALAAGEPPRTERRAGATRTLGDDAQATAVRRPARDEGRTLGESEEASFSRSRSETGFSEDLLNAALEPFGVRLQERAVDGPQLKLEGALDRAAEALARGIPVPIVLGRELGELQRYALMVQVQASGKSRAFQLYDPVVQELVWAHEADLLRRVELPFENKAFRRITAIALPKGAAK